MDFDTDSFISSIDKDVWEAICTLTQTVKASSSTHSRKIRRIFITCVMLFTINRQCSFPLHTLITETLLSLIHNLYSEFVVTGKKNYIISEGDQATYERIQSIKGEYRDDSTWLIPFVGDWHFLKNYQEVLLKVYFDGSLCDLAIASKYQPKSIGTNFTRTHHFLLEVWEALFRVLMNFYLSKEAPTSFLPDISHMVESSPDCKLQDSVLRNLKEMLEEIDSKAKDMLMFTDTIAIQNHTLQFWCQFLFKDCLAYIALFLGICSGDWDLRVAALKLMVPLFTSFKVH